MKKTYILAALAALLSTSAVYASDLQTKTPRYVQSPFFQAPNWAGFYVGLNGGGGHALGNHTLAGGNAVSSAVIDAGFVPSSLNTSGIGGTFGGQIGYNYMFNALLVGAEADFGWTNFGGADGQSITIGPANLATNAQSNLRWLGTVRGRLGYTIAPTTLIYVTGGLAFGRVTGETSVVLTAPAPFGAAAVLDTSATKTGWTVGAGLEQVLGASNWSVKAEYLYVDLGSIGGNLAADVNGTPVSFDASQRSQYHIARIGVNYRF